jgi:hypothetical protein
LGNESINVYFEPILGVDKRDEVIEIRESLKK